MKNFNFFRAFAFIFVFLFTFILRAHNYDRIPMAGHLDEQLYAWSGIYFVETGVPVSWSTLEYPLRAKVFSGKISYRGGIPSAGVNLYKPWLDEPPLFSLLVGYFAHLFGADRNQFIPSSFIRFPVVLISTLTSIFVFLIARKLSGFWTGTLAMLLYGTIPIFVFASRTALPENLISLFYMISIFLLLKFKEKKKFWWILPIPILAGIAGLSKPTGYFILPFTLFFVFKWLYESGKAKLALKYSLWLLAILAPFIAAFFVYGIKMDAEIFWKILSIQGNRPAGFGSLAWFFMTPSYDTGILRDSLFVFCLISAAYFIFSPKSGAKRIISFSFVYWLIIVMLSAGESDLLAWYRFPTYPALAIMGAWGIQELVKRADFFSVFISIGMFWGNRSLWVNAFRPNVIPGTYRAIFTGIMAIPVMGEIFNKKVFISINRLLIILLLFIGIYINSAYIYQAYEIACQGAECPLVESTFLATVRFPSLIRWFILDLPAKIL